MKNGIDQVDDDRVLTLKVNSSEYIEMSINLKHEQSSKFFNIHKYKILSSYREMFLFISLLSSIFNPLKMVF
jgi:hypothetical protein